MAPVAGLGQFLDRTRRQIDAALDRALPSPPACPAVLADAMRYSVMAGGKRLRPVLLLAAADAIGRRTGDEAAGLALPAACAVEFIHTYSLIHDDLPAMDNDTLRRGRPTLHVVFGDGLAILAGDALQAEAFALLTREPSGHDPAMAARQLAAAHIIAHAAGGVGMVGGQATDLAAAGQVPGHGVTLDGPSIQAMHLQKTGALIRASALSGAILAGASPDAADAVDRWGAEVGLAFQIVDDILDVEGSAADLGKTAGKDAAGAKPTYPAAFGLERARLMAAACGDRAHQILVAADLTDGWLDAIADWIITRKN